MSELPKLPKWTDPGSVSSFLFALLAIVVAVLKIFHPATHTAAEVGALIPAIALVVAFLALAVNIYTHRQAHGIIGAAIEAAKQPQGQVDLDQLAPKLAAALDQHGLAAELAPYLSLIATDITHSETPAPVVPVPPQ